MICISRNRVRQIGYALSAMRVAEEVSPMIQRVTNDHQTVKVWNKYEGNIDLVFSELSNCTIFLSDVFRISR